ncbi:MAG: acyl-CoA dehydrogenase family protein [Microbacteriaceae bacterium]
MTIVDRPATDAARLLPAVERYAERVLRPGAAHAASAPIPAERVAELRALGALNHLAGPEWGGLGATTAQDRRVHELVAAGCFNTWLVWAQHASSVGFAAGALAKRGTDAAPGPHTQALLRGDRLAGAALSDLRRFPDRYLAARRDGAGWRIDGRVSWFSGWGLGELIVVGAIDERQRVIVGVAELDATAVTAEPLELGSLAGSRTAALRLEGLRLDDAEVLSVASREQWALRDEQLSVSARPQVLALLAEAVELLAAEPEAAGLAEQWRAPVAELREHVYALADREPGAEPSPRLHEQRREARVRSASLLAELSRALLIARAGRGLLAGDPARRLADHAAFLQVQSQTVSLRRAQLGSLLPASDPR